MKKVILFIATVLLMNISFAQDYTNEEIEVIQELFGSEKKAIIDENINLYGVDSEKFWKLYDEYEAQRRDIAKEKLELLHKYSLKTGAVSNTLAEELLKKAIIIRAAQDNLIMKYSDKIKKNTSPLVASQFYQIEHYISDGIRFTILDNMDFIQDKN
ncbi:MAG: hypothetical protein ABFR32_06715 [Bacteroidota bacterium]